MLVHQRVKKIDISLQTKRQKRFKRPCLGRTSLEIRASGKSCPKFRAPPPSFQNCQRPNTPRRRSWVSMTFPSQLSPVWRPWFRTRCMKRPEFPQVAAEKITGIPLGGRFMAWINTGSIFVWCPSKTKQLPNIPKWYSHYIPIRPITSSHSWLGLIPKIMDGLDGFHLPTFPDLQGALKIRGISVQQLILQEPMLLPQGAHLLVDLGEKVQQPPLLSALKKKTLERSKIKLT